MFKIYRRFLDGLPEYLARHYWWAYLWRPGIWFFDHQFIINAILFGQYKKLMNATLARFKRRPAGRVLQLSCVYGELTSHLLEALAGEQLQLIDVSDRQLLNTRNKLGADSTLSLARMDAECLAYSDNSFSTIVLFFLLHEMPGEARQRVISECVRILDDQGILILTEYGAHPERHYLYRFPIARRMLTRLEPFLESFWREDLHDLLKQGAEPGGKTVKIVTQETFFRGFYSVTTYRVRENQKQVSSANS